MTEITDETPLEIAPDTSASASVLYVSAVGCLGLSALAAAEVIETTNESSVGLTFAAACALAGTGKVIDLIHQRRRAHT